VAVELSRHAKQVYLITRSGTWLLSRVGPGGIPLDYYFSTRCAARLHERRGRTGVPRLTWFLMTPSATNMLPLSIRNFFSEMQLRGIVDLDLYGLTPRHHLLSAHPSINGELIGRINTGVRGHRPRARGGPYTLTHTSVRAAQAVLVRPNIRAFRPHAIVYEDGQEYPCDAVVFATGYDVCSGRGPPFVPPRALASHCLPAHTARSATRSWTRPVALP
jgi:dimethylaniline monooxygenase (N-oxide forming)